MDCSSPSSELPKKNSKTTSTNAGLRIQAESNPSSPTPNIVQRIKYIMALEPSASATNKRLLHQEIADNLTVFDMYGSEFLTVNAPLSEIANWTPQQIPY